MYFSTMDARLTLEALDKLIAATECRALLSKVQRNALAAQRQSRDQLSRLLEIRQQQAANKIVSLALWRDGLGAAPPAPAVPGKTGTAKSGTAKSGRAKPSRRERPGPYSAATDRIELS
jgi:hypothetical protein